MGQVSNSIMIGTGGGTTITVVANYSALPDPTTVTGQFYWAEASQGTSWLPGSLGGTYYNSGMYYSNGTNWSFVNVPYQATQAEVNTGTNDNKFVTPNTFANASKWNTKQDSLTDVNFGSFSNGLTAKTTPVDADTINIVDSADSNKSKKTSWLNVWTNYLKPKADAVYQSYFYKDTTSSTPVTATTSNTILVSALIPANTFTTGSDFEVICQVQRVGANAGASFRMYKNTSLSLSGATQLANVINGVTNLTSPFRRLFVCRATNLVGSINTNTNVVSDLAVSNTAYVTTAFDFTVDNYIIIAVEPSSASDSFTSESFIIKGNK